MGSRGGEHVGVLVHVVGQLPRLERVPCLGLFKDPLGGVCGEGRSDGVLQSGDQKGSSVVELEAPTELVGLHC